MEALGVTSRVLGDAVNITPSAIRSKLGGFTAMTPEERKKIMDYLRMIAGIHAKLGRPMMNSTPNNSRRIV